MRRTTAFLLSILCLFLTACSDSVYEIDLSHMLEESGEYVFPGLTWGITPQEAARLLGFAITELPSATPEAGFAAPVTRVMTPEDELLRVKLNGSYGAPRFQFADDRLVSVILVFKTTLPGMERNNLKALFEKTDAQMRELFGEPSQETADQTLPNTAALISSYHWNGPDDGDPRTRNSMLYLGCVKDADGNFITVSVMASKSIVVQGS